LASLFRNLFGLNKGAEDEPTQQLIKQEYWPLAREKERIQLLSPAQHDAQSIREHYQFLAKWIQSALPTGEKVLASLKDKNNRKYLAQGISDARKFAEMITYLNEDRQGRVELKPYLQQLIDQLFSTHYRNRGMQFSADLSAVKGSVNIDQSKAGFLLLCLMLYFRETGQQQITLNATSRVLEDSEQLELTMEFTSSPRITLSSMEQKEQETGVKFSNTCCLAQDQNIEVKFLAGKGLCIKYLILRFPLVDHKKTIIANGSSTPH
jgi:hypothetical protein